MTWYPKYTYSKDVEAYLSLIELVFKVQHADGNFKELVLQNHQREFHALDIGITGVNAKHTVVKKSRNTSFTISSIIRLLCGNYSFRNEEVPFVRINDTKVKELFREIMKLVKYMRPVRLENGDMWPFNPATVVATSHEIRFPDRNVLFLAYPAKTAAADNIRGLRITRGFNDECNFESEFKEIHVAMRDAARGSFGPQNKSYFQLTYGSTLRGNTPFLEFLTLIEQKTLSKELIDWVILHWPVFNPQVFNCSEPVITDDLVPIVPWHSLSRLRNALSEDVHTFLEEYMGVSVPSQESLYFMNTVLACVNNELQNCIPKTNNPLYVGIDVAGEGGDYFSISIFELVHTTFVQRYVYYEKKTVDLEEKKLFCEELLRVCQPTKCRVDSNGIGFFLGQYLQKKFPYVESIRGNVRIHSGKSQSIPLTEFIHTNQLRLFSSKSIELVNDEEQLAHYPMWDRSFKAKRSSTHGHGDIVISNGLALLPDNWRFADREKKVLSTLNEKELVRSFRPPVVQW